MMATRAMKRSTSPGSFMMSLVPTRAPMTRPMIWAGSAAAATQPRWAASRPNRCS